MGLGQPEVCITPRQCLRLDSLARACVQHRCQAQRLMSLDCFSCPSLIFSSSMRVAAAWMDACTCNGS